jgi:uncharacterized protein YbaP (TraB family)
MIYQRDIMPAKTRPANKAAPKAAASGKTQLFHAKMLVTRLEEWCVEAATSEEARALLAAGAGHRCTPGDSVQVEFDRLIEE